MSLPLPGLSSTQTSVGRSFRKKGDFCVHTVGPDRLLGPAQVGSRAVCRHGGYGAAPATLDLERDGDKVCMHVCMCVHVICIHVSICARVFVSVHMCMQVPVCTRVRECMCVYTCLCGCVHECMCVPVCT